MYFEQVPFLVDKIDMLTFLVYHYMLRNEYWNKKHTCLLYFDQNIFLLHMAYNHWNYHLIEFLVDILNMLSFLLCLNNIHLDILYILLQFLRNNNQLYIWNILFYHFHLHDHLDMIYIQMIPMYRCIYFSHILYILNRLCLKNIQLDIIHILFLLHLHHNLLNNLYILLLDK